MTFQAKTQQPQPNQSPPNGPTPIPPPAALYSDPAYYAAVYEETVLANQYIPKRPPWNAPHAPQTLFLLLPVPEGMFGGAAGGGKSDALLMGAVQYQSPEYHSLILRRTYRDLALPGALISRAHQWWDGTDAKWYEKDHKWSFPKGNTLTFGYLEHDSDVYGYQSAEFQYIGFDELTQFLEFQYTFLFSRLRRLAGSVIPLRMRSASNPGGRGHSWVREHFVKQGIKLDYRQGISAADVRRAVKAFQDYIETDPDVLDDPTTLAEAQEMERQRREVAETPDTDEPEGADSTTLSEDEEMGRLLIPPVFVPSKLEDNPAVDRKAYVLMLSKLDPVLRQQMRHGDWDVVPGVGLYQPDWFQILEEYEIPDLSRAQRVRSWDLAATEKAHSDYSVGTLIAKLETNYYILDVKRVRGRPEHVKALLQATAADDGKGTAIYVEREGGSGGAIAADTIKHEWLQGYEVWTPWPGSNKVTRAKTTVSLAADGKIHLRRAGWNAIWIEEMSLWPAVEHDDQGDSFHSGINALNDPRQKRFALLMRGLALPSASLTGPSRFLGR